MLSRLLKRDDAYEFQPLLTEIEDRPLSPLGRTTFWLIIGVIIFLILWTCIGKVDIVVSARGKVIPDGNIKIVQPFETGIIRKIFIKEGDFVRKGQILAEIDPSSTEPQMMSMKKNLDYINIEAQRLSAEANSSAGIAILPPVPSLDGANTQQTLYNSAMDSLNNQLSAKRMELRRTDEQIKASQTERNGYITLLNTATDKEKRLSAVADLIAQDDLIKVHNDISSYKTQIKQIEYKLKELTHQKSQTMEEIAYVRSNFRTENLKELSEREKQSTQIKANLDEISFRNKKQRIVSPVDGYVNSLAIHTVGGVVTPAEKLISIVPAKSPLLIKANLSNRDVGFVKAGMPVALKIDTFDFQKYGILKGKVKQVSKDSIDDQKLGPVYEVYIIPLTTSLKVEGKDININTGMTATGEIKVGTRHIIEFFIYPIVKYLNEGMSVR